MVMDDYHVAKLFGPPLRQQDVYMLKLQARLMKRRGKG